MGATHYALTAKLLRFDNKNSILLQEYLKINLEKVA